MRSELIFNGQPFSAFDAYVATSNFLDGAAKDYTSVSVLGRSGDLQISNNRYKNITVKVRVYVRSNMEQNIRAMRSYLESVNGYARLELSDQPNEYRIGLFKDMFAPKPYDRNVGAVELTFDCKPQRFLKSGEIPVSASSQSNTYTGNPVEIDNPSGLSAVSSLSVALNPIQNLNGYDSPWIGGAGKNKLPSHAVGSTTISGVTFTVNADGTVKVNGTATANASFTLSNITINGGILNGCPSGGGWDKYVLAIDGGATDTGSSATVGNISNKSVYIFIRSGYTANNFVFKPMIRETGTSADYEPYSNICPIYASNGKNLLQITATSQTVNGVTFTVNADGTVKANGTASSAAEFVIKSDVSGNTYAGMILSGCPNGGGGSTYRLFEQVQGSPWTYLASDGGSGVTIPTTTYTTVRFVIRIESGISVNNLVFKPMIRPASITDSTYVPYQSIMVTRTGKNVLVPYAYTTTNSGVQFVYKANGDIVLNGTTTAATSVPTSGEVTVRTLLKAGTYTPSVYGDNVGIQVIAYNPVERISEGGTFTLTHDREVFARLSLSANQTYNNAVVHMQIELGSSATDYEPYQGNTYTINLNGTRYGGSVDLVTGVLTVDTKFMTFNGTEAWETINIGFRCALTDRGVTRSAKQKSNWLTGATDSEPDPTTTHNYKFNCVSFIGVGGIASSLAEFKSLLASQPLQICYELTTPQTVQLTPQQISLLTGINYISSSDEVTVTVSEPSLLENPTLFESKPLIRVYGHGTLTINNQYITIAENPYEYIDIDCDIMDAFYGANNANQYVTLPNDYITLHSGNNYIAYDGTVQITPRWYEV